MGVLKKADEYLTNLSIGAGGTITSGLEGTLQALRNPRVAAGNMAKGALRFAADPLGSVQEAAGDYAERLSSGPIGVGSVLGEFLPSPGRVGSIGARGIKSIDEISPYPSRRSLGVRKRRETLRQKARAAEEAAAQESMVNTAAGAVQPNTAPTLLSDRAAMIEALRRKQASRAQGHARARRWAAEARNEDAFKAAQTRRRGDR